MGYSVFRFPEERYSVNIRRDPATGVVFSEAWYNGGGKLDRSGDAALIVRDATTGIVTYEGWFKDGKRDRADGPAVIQRNRRTGVVSKEEWWKDGWEHPGPSHYQGAILPVAGPKPLLP